MKYKTPCSWALSLYKHTPKFLIFVLAILLSSQASAQWTKQTALTATKINTIAVDPVDANKMLVGTGYIDTNPNMSGLYQSNNGGVSWTQVFTASSSAGPISLIGQAVRSISIEPGSTQFNRKIYAVIANKGIFKSLDGGLNWSAAQIQNPQNPSLFLTQNVSQVVVTQFNGFSQKTYAVVSNDEDGYIGTAGIYATTNDGLSWQKVSTGLTQKVIKLLVPVTQPDTLYVITQTNELMKSTNGGSLWSAASSGLPIGINSAIIDFIIDPANSNNLYASAFGSGVQGIYYSNNGGTSWTVANNLNVFTKLAIGSTAGSLVSTLYGIKNDAFAGSVIPSYAVYTSINNGTTWTKLDAGFPSQLSTQALDAITTANSKVYVGGQEGLYVFGTGGVSACTTPFCIDVTSTSLGVTAGQAVPLNITLRNSGASIFTTVTLTSSTLPQGSSLAAGSSPQCTMNTFNSTLSCTVSSIQTGVPVTLPVNLQLPSFGLTSGLSLTFTASGGANGSGFINLPLSGGATTCITPFCVDVTSTSLGVTAGQAVPLNITLRNSGASIFTTVTLTSSTLPQGSSLAAGSSPQCTMNTFNSTLSCTVSSIQTGVPVTLPVNLQLPSFGLTSGLSLTFTASGGANGSGFINLPLSGTGIGGAGVFFDVISSNPSVSPNSLVTLTATLRNDTGAQINSAVTISNTLTPFPLNSVVTSTNLNCLYSSATRVMTCSVPSMTVGQLVSLPISVTLPSSVTGTALQLTFNASGTSINTSDAVTLSLTGFTPGVGGTAPVANPVSLSTTLNTAVQGQLNVTGLADSGVLTYKIVTNGQRGVLSFNNMAAGTIQHTSPLVTYTPNLNQTGFDSITYMVTDSLNRSSQTATVTVNITSPTQSPTPAPTSSTSGGAVGPLGLLIFGMLPLVFRRRQR